MIRRTLITFIFSSSFLASGFSLQAMAEARYISDILHVPMRSGPTNSNKIVHRGLKSGTRVEFIRQENEEFSLVRTKEGVEGYIRTQYLLKNVGAREQVAIERTKVERLQKENKKLSTKLGELTTQNSSLKNSGAQSSQQSTRLKKELDELKAISSKAVTMVARNKALVEKNVLLNNRIETLELENSRLSDDSAHQWYLYGAVTIIIGILMGLAAPLLRSRRKSSSDWV